jgi:hypothetical protein
MIKNAMKQKLHNLCKPLHTMADQETTKLMLGAIYRKQYP